MLLPCNFPVAAAEAVSYAPLHHDTAEAAPAEEERGRLHYVSEGSKSDEDVDAGAEAPQGFSSSRRFQHGVGVVIVLNTILIALEAQFIHHDGWRPVMERAELAFTGVYVLELGLRLRDRGLAFFTEGDSGWNVFDFLVTSTSVVDATRAALGAGGAGGVGFSGARLFRVLRILRLFRALRFLQEIDIVIATAAKATVKLALLTAGVVFVAAIIATNMLWDSGEPVVAAMFADLGASLWSMFKLMTLENWIDTVEQVVEAEPSMLVFFVCYIFCASIALMSLVPAIFIELNMTTKEKEREVAEQKRRQRCYAAQKKTIEYLFRMTDADNNGRASVSEMFNILGRETTIASLKARGICHEGSLRQMKLGLFDLCDAMHSEYVDQDVEITQEEFVQGVVQAQLEMNDSTIWTSTTATRKRLHELSSYLRTELTAIRGQAKRDSELVNLIRSEIAGLREALQSQPSRPASEAASSRRGSVHAFQAGSTLTSPELPGSLQHAEERRSPCASPRASVGSTKGDAKADAKAPAGSWPPVLGGFWHLASARGRSLQGLREASSPKASKCGEEQRPEALDGEQELSPAHTPRGAQQQTAEQPLAARKPPHTNGILTDLARQRAVDGTAHPARRQATAEEQGAVTVERMEEQSSMSAQCRPSASGQRGLVQECPTGGAADHALQQAKAGVPERPAVGVQRRLAGVTACQGRPQARGEVPKPLAEEPGSSGALCPTPLGEQAASAGVQQRLAGAAANAIHQQAGAEEHAHQSPSAAQHQPPSVTQGPPAGEQGLLAGDATNGRQQLSAR